jgi:oligopeptide/dipeptide ABC transporter ATP-binding protein
MSAALEVSNLTRVFEAPGARPLVAVDGVDLTLGQGETLGIVGESGCGKSTLARLILKLLPASGGRIRIGDVDVTDLGEAAMRPLRRNIQAVFQDPMSSLNPRMRVREIVAEPLRAAGIARGAREARVREMLAVVGLPEDSGERYPHAFSGGQRQRIAIARALAASPKIVICDEATSALDVSVQAQVLNLLAELRARFGLTLLFISHNLGAVRHVADRVAIMYLGRVVEIGPQDAIFDRPAHPYTEALIAAVPEPDPDLPPPPPLAGEIPSPRDRPAGCHFHPRCPKVQARCRIEAPAPTQLGPAHAVRCHYPNLETAP